VANSGTRLHGKGGAIYIGGTYSAKNALPVGGVRVAVKAEWTLNRSRDYVDVTSFGDPNKVWQSGLPDVSGTFRGTLDISGDLLLNSATSDAQNLFLYASDGFLGSAGIIMVAHGPALIDAQVTVSNTDAARISGNFRASDAWDIVL
jgi:predicted secreted protein